VAVPLEGGEMLREYAAVRLVATLVAISLLGGCSVGPASPATPTARPTPTARSTPTARPNPSPVPSWPTGRGARWAHPDACNRQSISDADARPYLDLPGLRTGDLSAPYVKGKIVVVKRSAEAGPSCAGYGEIHSFCDSTNNPYPKLSVCRLVAERPEEVGTVVWLDCSAGDSVGSYQSGGRAYPTTCVVTIIDKAANRIVGEKTFGPVDPPRVIACNVKMCDGYGDPSEDIYKYLLSLPRE
jgi:hypothetical protein